jgi:hypothetical protein
MTDKNIETQSAWFRFTGSDKTIVGEVKVPRIVPTWFAPALTALNIGAKRDLTMADISPRQWLDELCSRGLPVPLRTPLLTKLVAEDLYVPEAELTAAEVKDEKGEVVGLKHEMIKTVLATSDLSRLQEKGHDLQKEYGNLIKVPPEVIGQRPRQRIVHLPLLDPNEEKARTFAVFASAFMVFVELEDSSAIQRVADGVYGVLDAKKVQLLTPAGV